MVPLFVAGGVVLLVAVVATVGWFRGKRRPPFNREAYLVELRHRRDVSEQERIVDRARTAFESKEPFWIHRSGATPELAKQSLREELERQRPMYPADLEVDSTSIEIPDVPYKGLYDSAMKITFRSRTSVS